MTQVSHPFGSNGSESQLQRPPLSLKPSEAVKAAPSLGDYLARGEERGDFENDGHNGKLKPRPKFVDWTLDGLEVAVAMEAKKRRLPRTAVQRVATKVGLLLLPSLPGWSFLEKGYWAKVNHLGEHIDPAGIRFLEATTTVSFQKRRSKKHSVGVYSWVSEKIQEASMVAGLPQVAIINTTLILAFSTLPKWGPYYAPDIEVVMSHIRGRQALMDVEQTDEVLPEWLRMAA